MRFILRWALGCSVVILVVSLLVAAPARGKEIERDPPRLPTGFTLKTYDPELGPWRLTNFVFTPSGDILATTRDGQVGLLTASGDARTLLHLDVDHESHRGLMGIDLHPDFPRKNEVFLLYTKKTEDDPVGILSAWRLDDPERPTRLLDETVIVEGIPALYPGQHTIGTVIAAPDGSFYLGSGDGSHAEQPGPEAFAAQDLKSPLGKIMRVRRDGSGHPANPYFDPGTASSWTSRVHSLGWRNPFRFVLNDREGGLYVGDVGWNDFEEINVAAPGTNHGWPCWEGSRPTPFYSALPECTGLHPSTITTPIWTYPHGSSDEEAGAGAVITGAIVSSRRYSTQSGNGLAVADYTRGHLWILHLRNSGGLVIEPDTQRPVASNLGRPVAIGKDPAGNLCVGDLETSFVYCMLQEPQVDVGVATSSSYGSTVLRLLALALPFVAVLLGLVIVVYRRRKSIQG